MIELYDTFHKSHSGLPSLSHVITDLSHEPLSIENNTNGIEIHAYSKVYREINCVPASSSASSPAVAPVSRSQDLSISASWP